MRIITFYNSQYYKNLAIKLIVTGKTLGYNIEAKEVKCSGWKTAVGMKPGMLLAEYAKSKKEPLLYLDADIFLQKPLDKLFQIIEANDISVRRRYDGNTEPFNLGVMGFGVKNYAYIVKFLNSWALKLRNVVRYTQSVDQQPFTELLPVFPKLKIQDITLKYNFLPSDEKNNDRFDAAIFHYKASRDQTNESSRKWRKHFTSNRIPKA